MARPFKFKSVEELQQKIDAYFGDCDPHVAKRKFLQAKVDGGQYLAEEEYITEQKPYTVSGLALALDTNRQTLNNYQSADHYPEDMDPELRQGLIDTITRAKARCEEFNERLLLDPNNRNSKGVTFNLTNNFNWKDKSEIEHTGFGWDDLAEDDEDKDLTEGGDEDSPTDTGASKEDPA